LSRIMFLLILGLCTLASAPGEAQESRCADCHFANPQADPDPNHLQDWDRSPHGRQRVGCEGCHKGNAATTESFLAHQGVLTSRNPSSPVHRNNLPRTCGACHTGAFVAFQKSRHYELLGEGSGDGPSCSTCHGSVGAELLSPRRLQQQCETCHAADGDFPQPDVAFQGRLLLEEAALVRELLRQATGLIERVEDQTRQRVLEDAYQQAQVPLTEAVQAGHAFVFDQMKERLTTARERSIVLLNELANPE
jgi:hypothetical protein